MALEAGARLGPYEIVGLIGAGGMGEVYRARDTRLDRTVAVKVLVPELAGDAEFQARFTREAKAISALNHPHICGLYDIGREHETEYLVLELVEGETLAARLERGSLPLSQVLRFGIEIADALEAAHRQGIVHRDLKPGNIMLTAAGTKLLDFGLAKHTIGTPGQALSMLATAPGTGTAHGTIIGTLQYMAPEQIQGAPADARTDLFALGTILYEMATGRHAFEATTQASLIAKILETHVPAVSALAPLAPPVFDHVVQACLAKEPADRWQTAHDVKLQLQWIQAKGSGTGLTESAVMPRRPRTWVLWTAAAATVLIGLGTALGTWVASRGSTERVGNLVTRLTMNLQDGLSDELRIPLQRPFIPLAVSADGARMAWYGRGAHGQQLFVREFSAFQARALPGTQGATTPFFSPDGRWVGFWADGMLRRISVAGGPSIDIGKTTLPRFAVWGAHDEIFYDTVPGPLWSISAKGGEPKAIRVRTPAAGERIALHAELPGGDLLVSSVGPSASYLEVLSRKTGERRRIMRGGISYVARYLRTGHLVYGDADSLFAVAVDAERLEPVGAPIPVIQGIHNFLGRFSSIAVSDSGTVAYLPAERVQETALVWVDRAGNVTSIPGAGGNISPHFRLSPDGRALGVTLSKGAQSSVWILDLERGTRRLIAEADSYGAVWSRGGAFVTYRASRAGGDALFRRRADGTGSEERLAERRSTPYPTDWSPDDRTLLFEEAALHGGFDVWAYSGGPPTLFLAGSFDQRSPTFSPDGRLVAYQSGQTSDENVYVQPFPGPGARTTVSSESGGGPPRWGPGGRNLYYISGRKMMVVTVEREPELHVGRPRTVFESTLAESTLAGHFDISPDGKRFLMVTPRTTTVPLEVRVILHWDEELERLAPHPRR